jgi:hypothetical protein
VVKNASAGFKITHYRLFINQKSSEVLMRILHLSDIHFGRNNEKYKVEGCFNNKVEILENLLLAVRDLKVKPNHIMIVTPKVSISASITST